MPGKLHDEAVPNLTSVLAGDARAIREFVDRLTPVIQARVARALLRQRMRSDRDIRQEVEDLTQEVFLALFEKNRKALAAWDPQRGMGLNNFIGLIAEREVISILRSRKRSPWTESPSELDAIDANLEASPAADRDFVTREELGVIYERLRDQLSPKGLDLFHRLFIEGESVEAVCEAASMKADAVYAWRSRLAKLVRSVGSELDAEGGLPVSVGTTSREVVKPGANDA